MSEPINKLEPHRTIHLRGVDRHGAMASLSNCSATAFRLSGVFRDMADFAVLMLWDGDDYFGHWQTTKYLPDFDFAGMTLTFDLSASGVQQLDSTANQWIPWRSLNYIEANGAPGTLDLAPHITKVAGTQGTASTTFTVLGSPQLWDRAILWYQNIAFEYVVQPTPATAVSSVTVSYYNAGGTGTEHTLTIDGVTYSYFQGSGDSSGACAAGVYAAASADLNVVLMLAGNQIVVHPGVTGTGISVQASDGTDCYVWRDSTDHIAAAIAGYINAFNWTGYTLPLSAVASGSNIIVSCAAPGADGNQITMYATVPPGSSVGISPLVAQLTGGSSAATWRVSIDFSALGIDQLRQLWLTFAPQLPNATAYVDTEWLVDVTNWTVSDPAGHRPLKIAGPGSVRIGSRDRWVTYDGASWAEEASNQPGGTGWFWQGFAHRMNAPGDSVTVQYSCQHSHELYLGTSLYSDRGIVAISIDGGAPTPLDCFVGSAPSGPICTRRWLASVAAGSHTVVITLTADQHAAIVSTPMWDTASSGHFFYFDYVEAAVRSDVLDPAVIYPDAMPATDFDTDHSYKLSPQRLVWMLSRLGFGGEIDHYLGVFWWNQRKRVGGTYPAVVVTVAGTWAAGDLAFVSIGGFTLGKSVFAGDTKYTIAAHFCYLINEIFTGVRASVAGAVLTITLRTPEWSFTYDQSYSSTASGSLAYTGSLTGGVEGTWMIDDTITPVINRAVTDWHADFWREVAAQGWSAVAAFSMELVDPPDDPAAGAVYAQRYSDGTEVKTDTGFGGLASTQCTFSPTVLNYQKQAFAEMAGLMAAAGLTPWLQCGEFLWWFFSRVHSLPVGYASYTAPISIGTATPHGLLTGQGVMTVGIQGDTAANVETSCTVVDSTHVTLDGTSGNGAYTGGGTISGGGMAYYDAFTTAAAAFALGRSLASFWTQDDDPSAHSADVAFLAAQLKAHIDGIRSYVLAAYPAAKFELLFPLDVCHPTPYFTNDLPYPQGGRLNYAVNLPAAYLAKSGSGLDRMKMEGLSWSATYRDLDQVRRTIEFPWTVGAWAPADTRYLIPWFNGGCCWRREYRLAVDAGIPSLGLWAFDQVCLLGWPLPLPAAASRVRFL